MSVLDFEFKPLLDQVAHNRLYRASNSVEPVGLRFVYRFQVLCLGTV